MPTLSLDFSELMSLWDSVRASGQFTEGAMVRAFEAEVETWTGLHAVAVNSAGTGLYAMLRMAKHLGTNGGPVAVPVNTFYATGAMAREARHQVLLVDCNRADFSMSYTALMAVERRSALSMVVLTHVGGGLARDYPRIADLCQRRGILLFEDAAHVLGVGELGQTAGVLGDAAVFSLYPTKAIPVGEGGVIVTRYGEFAERLREFRNYGKYVVDGVIQYRGSGFNFRMDEWTAAVALLQMRRRREILARRQAVADKLARFLPPMVPWGPGQSNWYKYPVEAHRARELGLKRLSGAIYRRSDQLDRALGIADQGPFPNAAWVADNHVCLPVEEPMADWSDETLERWLKGA